VRLPQQHERRFAVKLPDVPILVFEDEFAGEENAGWEVKMDDLASLVSSSMGPFDVFGAAVALCIDRAHIHEDAILEVAGS
jgi:hypothetical protein